MRKGPLLAGPTKAAASSNTAHVGGGPPPVSAPHQGRVETGVERRPAEFC